MPADDAAMDAIRESLRERTGLRVQDRDVDELRSILRRRARATGAGDLPEYADRLQAEPLDGSDEWQRIVSAWTNNESFLFRDDGQIALLRDRILPDLVEGARRRRRLRVWSAGCSTGEEVYTLAILLHETTPPGWDVEVVGTDIDDEALDQAREAVYSSNAFRRTSEATRDRYFEPHGGGYRPIEPIRASTTFLHHNLLDDRVPPEVQPADLVLCRNVFIYFDREAVETAVERFAPALRVGGFLMTGHTELMGIGLDGFAPRSLPGSVIHERVAAGEGPPPTPTTPRDPPPAPWGAVAPAAETGPRERSSRRSQPRTPADEGVPEPQGPPSTPPEEARERIAEADPAGALAVLEEAGLDPASPTERLLAARAHADLGRLEEARSLAEDALDEDPFEADGHLLLARVSLEEGDREAARSHLERVLYLDDARLVAYVELAWVYEDEGLPDRAETMRSTALDIAAGMDPDAPAPGYPDTTSGELADHLRTVLKGGRGEEVTP